MHYLQKYILDRLRFEQPLAYSDMLPPNMASSHFQYHLKLLTESGLVKKEARGAYMLTHEGEQALEYMSVGRTTMIRMPKVITFTMITFKNQVLLLKKPKEPYRHLLELVGGKVHFGEDVTDAAQREIFEKTTWHMPPPQLAGVADIVINKNGQPLTHMTVYVHRLELKELPTELPSHAMFVDIKDMRPNSLAPSTLPIIKAIHEHDTLFVIKLRLDYASHSADITPPITV